MEIAEVAVGGIKILQKCHITHDTSAYKFKNINLFMCKYTFSPYILTFFHFGPYILILPLLVPKPINACYFRHFRQSTDGNSWGGSQSN